MAIARITPTPTAVVEALLARRKQPRLFLLEWDNRKTKTRDPHKNVMQEAWGTCYPNGLVTLDNGQRFDSLSEMHHVLDLHGSYEIHWLDEEDAGRSDVPVTSAGQPEARKAPGA